MAHDDRMSSRHLPALTPGRRPAVRLLCVAFVVACCGVGCDDEGGDLGEGTDKDPRPFARCDIRELDCQQRCFRQLAQYRGVAAEAMPTVTVIPVADFVAELEASTAPSMERSPADRALEVLGLLAPETGLVQAEAAALSVGVAAYYSPDDRSVTIVDRGMAMDDEEAVSVLIHELVHAMQDSELGLYRYTETHGTSTDSYLASLAMIEGEASLYEIMAYLQLTGIRAHASDWERMLTQLREWTFAAIDEAANPITVAMLAFPYNLGLEYLYHAWDAGGSSAVAAAVAAPPATTAQVLRGHHAVPPAVLALQWEWPATERELAGVDVLGAWLSAVLLRLYLSHEQAMAAATSWRVDEIRVFDRPSATGEVCVAWAMSNDSTPAERLWQEVSEAAPARLRFSSVDELAVISGCEMADDVDAWQSTVQQTTLSTTAPRSRGPVAAARRVVGRGGLDRGFIPRVFPHVSAMLREARTYLEASPGVPAALAVAVVEGPLRGRSTVAR